jgi:hypothetical protein
LIFKKKILTLTLSKLLVKRKIINMIKIAKIKRKKMVRYEIFIVLINLYFNHLRVLLFVYGLIVEISVLHFLFFRAESLYYVLNNRYFYWFSLIFILLTSIYGIISSILKLTLNFSVIFFFTFIVLISSYSTSAKMLPVYLDGLYLYLILDLSRLDLWLTFLISIS